LVGFFSKRIQQQVSEFEGGAIEEHEVESTHDIGEWGKQNYRIVDCRVIRTDRTEEMNRDERKQKKGK